MYKLPLFPLNSVLFPGMPLALHIFEDRYKLMIGRCIKNRRPFGVVLIKKGFEALGPPAQPHRVGCSAQITQVEQLKEGRMNIGAIGRERFQIISLESQDPYLVGLVEPYPLAEPDPAEIAAAARRLRPWVVRYLSALSQIEGLDLKTKEIPNDPKTLAYLAASLLQAPATDKQSLLEVEQTALLLVELRTLYRREIPFLKMMIAHPAAEDQGVFSLN